MPTLVVGMKNMEKIAAWPRKRGHGTQFSYFSQAMKY